MILERLARACTKLDAYLLDVYNDRGNYTPSGRFPMRDVHSALTTAGLTYLGRGHFKMVFDVPGTPYVLKVGAQKIIAYELSVYRRIPRGLRSLLMVPFYWSTRYCLLQEKVILGSIMPREEVDRILPLAAEAKLTDLRYRNFGLCTDGFWRLFDYLGFDDVSIGLRGLTGILHTGHNPKRTRNPLDNLITYALPSLSQEEIQKAFSTQSLGLDARGFSSAPNPGVRLLRLERETRGRRR